MLKNNLTLLFCKAFNIVVNIGGTVTKDLDLVYKSLFLKNGMPRHISVFVSGINNIGTSWCSLNLAYALTLEQKKVFLVDGNGNFSNISSYMFLKNIHPIEEYFDGNKTLNQLICAYKTQNFHILTAIAGGNYLAECPLGRIHVFADDLRTLAQNYDQTIIDLGTDLTLKNLGLCQIADNIFIMCSENSHDLVKTLDIIHFINKMNLAANCYLIINRVDSFEDGYKIYKELYKAVERNGLTMPSLLGMVRFDTRIRDTIKNKELLLSRYPASEAAIDIGNIAKKLCTESEYEQKNI